MFFKRMISHIYWKVIPLFIGLLKHQFVYPWFQEQKNFEASILLKDRYIRQSVDNLLTELRKFRISTHAMKKFQQLKNARNLSVELGGGAESLRSGWVNIDLLLQERDSNLSSGDNDLTFINYDLRLGLPLPDGSCNLIYSSHFFEHLEYIDALSLLQDCHRCLENGGRLRLALPDYRPVFTAYLSGDYDFFRVAARKRMIPGIQAGEETIADSLSLGIYERGQHKYIYDQGKCIKLLSQIGFRQVYESAFMDDIDIAGRRAHSFYIEASK